MAERFDRGILQVKRTKDAWELSSRINEELRKLSERIAKLEGRSGGNTVKNSLSIQSDDYVYLDMSSSVVGKASFSGTTGTTRTFEIAKGAKRAVDGQWVATDTGAVILSMSYDGTMTMYANTGLVMGAAFNPTVAIVFPSGTAQHGLVSSTHTATGLTAGQVLKATGTNTYGFGTLAGSNVSNTPAGDIAATTVQAAINELDTEKAPLAAKSCYAYSAVTQTNTDGNWAVVALETELWDSSSCHSTDVNNSRVVAPTTGYYLASAGLRWGTSATGYRGIRLEKNSAGTATATNVVIQDNRQNAGASQPTDQSVSVVVSMASADYLELFSAHAVGTSHTMPPTSGKAPFLSIHFLGT